jgi:hypothetical protein
MKNLYHRVGRTSTTGIYPDEVKREKILVIRINWDSRCSDKPVFYLKRKLSLQKAQFVTGLFETDDQQVFLGDIVDKATGMKIPLKITFLDRGEAIVIEGRRLW